MNYLSVPSIEPAIPMKVVKMKLTYVLLSVIEPKSSLSILKIIFELPFIFQPIFIQIIKIFVVKFLLGGVYYLVLHYSKPVELVIIKLAGVSYAAIRIVEDSVTLHRVFLPLAVVQSPFWVEEFSSSMPFIVELLSFIDGFVFKDLSVVLLTTLGFL